MSREKVMNPSLSLSTPQLLENNEAGFFSHVMAINLGKLNSNQLYPMKESTLHHILPIVEGLGKYIQLNSEFDPH